MGGSPVMSSLPIKSDEMMINSETLEILHEYYQFRILFQQKLSVNILAVVFFKLSDFKPINKSIFDIS